jgi:glutaredoxin 3
MDSELPSAPQPPQAQSPRQAPPVQMYCTSWCPYCERARRLLAHKGVPFEEIDLDAQPERREEMIQRAGGRRTVPQIFIGGRHVGGSDELYGLDAVGMLDRLLQAPTEQSGNTHGH